MDYSQALLTAVENQRNFNANEAAQRAAELAVAQARIAELEAQVKALEKEKE